MNFRRRDALLGLAGLPAVISPFPKAAAAAAPTNAARAGDDFYAYVNAVELERITLPPGATDFGQFNAVGDRVRGQIEALIAGAAAAGSPTSPTEVRVSTAYRAMLNEAGIERLSLPRLKRQVAEILAASTPAEVGAIMARPRSSSLVGFNIFTVDGEWMLYVDQQNQSQRMLGLSREDYEGADARSAEMRSAYVICIGEMFREAGVPDGPRRAAEMLALETEIARRLWSPERLRDRRANIHVMSAAELEAYAPGLPWAAMLKARGLEGADRINLGTDTAVAAQAQLFRDTPLDAWRSWLAFSWIRNGIDTAPAAMRDIYWAFSGDVVQKGAPRPSRQAEAARFVNQRLTMDVGRLYVEAHFSEDARRQVTELLTYVKRAMAQSLGEAQWLDASSRREALAKVEGMALKAGYPRRWPNDALATLSADDPAANLDALLQQDWASQLQRLTDKEARAELWYQAPQFVNASYNPQLNAIEVPAAILQPPFFSPGADPAENFGAIGAIVAHEMAHGFDDQGLLFDSTGSMREWMSPASQAAFTERAERMVAQVQAIEPLAGVKLNGRRTLGETVADLSGLSLALRAYDLWRADRNVRSDRGVDHRLFFRSWARVWVYKATDAAIRQIAERSYYVPAAYRVNLSVRNIDAWYAAFDVRPGDKLFAPPADRVRLW